MKKLHTCVNNNKILKFSLMLHSLTTQRADAKSHNAVKICRFFEIVFIMLYCGNVSNNINIQMKNNKQS